jgi:hypothetical protein
MKTPTLAMTDAGIAGCPFTVSGSLIHLSVGIEAVEHLAAALG